MKINVFDKKISFMFSLILSLTYFYSLFLLVNYSSIDVIDFIIESIVFAVILALLNSNIIIIIEEDKIIVKYLMRRIILNKTDIRQFDVIDKEIVSPKGYRQPNYKQYRVLIGKNSATKVIMINTVKTDIILDYSEELSKTLSDWTNS